MRMAAAAWDSLSKAANLAQISGLHAALLVVLLTTLLRVYQDNMHECARLEQCYRRLDALLQWSATSCGGVALLLCSQMGEPFGEVLANAAGLVESYKESTLWCRVRGGGRIATRLGEMQDVIDSYWSFMLLVNAHLLLQQQTVHHHPIPPSSDSSTITLEKDSSTTTIPGVNDDTSQSPSAEAVTGRPAIEGTQRAIDICQRGMNYDPATGSERNVPDDLPPV